MKTNLKAALGGIVALSLVLAMGMTLEVPAGLPRHASPQAARPASYLGFDRNDYPGDTNLPSLRQTFSFSGYWLNNPPGGNSNSWTGKRKTLQTGGFGFAVLFNGRTYAEIKTARDASKLGASDAADAVSAAHREGFPTRTIIFLDEEEGGRLLPEQRSYLHSWADGVITGGYRAGVYCSGIASKEGSGTSIVTAGDIKDHAGGRELHYWVVNDSCPPSPGCAFPKMAPSPAKSGVSFAEVWQFAQSPRRNGFSKGCPSNYDRDGNCYPPGVDPSQRLHLDLNDAVSSDPSHGRQRD